MTGPSNWVDFGDFYSEEHTALKTESMSFVAKREDSLMSTESLPAPILNVPSANTKMFFMALPVPPKGFKCYAGWVLLGLLMQVVPESLQLG